MVSPGAMASPGAHRGLGVRRRAVPREVYEKASVVGIALVLLLFFIGLSNDVGGRGG